MLRLLLFYLLACRVRSVFVTQSPSFGKKLEKLYEKLEKVTFAPLETSSKLALTPQEKIYAKLDQLNSLNPKTSDLTEDDEELLATLQEWGELSETELEGVMDDLQRLKDETDEVRSERIMEEDEGDAMWHDEESEAEDDYAMDDWDSDEAEIVPTVNNLKKGSPEQDLVGSRASNDGGMPRDYELTPAHHLVHTNRRPIILDDNGGEASELRQMALQNARAVRLASRCLTPQPRWLSVRQLMPAADTVYLPPCVQLHRCAPDAGCCRNESEVCAPVAGENVTAVFYLHQINRPIRASRILFYNHTQCACVPMTELRNPIKKVEEYHQNYRIHRVQNENSKEGQSDWLPPTEEPKLERDGDLTPPPQLRRCTCPGAFLAQPSDSGCKCVCAWGDIKRRRDCFMFARGKEHFGLRDRVCVANGDCNPPTCEYGSYNRTTGKCPIRMFKRLRYHARARSLTEPYV